MSRLGRPRLKLEEDQRLCAIGRPNIIVNGAIGPDGHESIALPISMRCFLSKLNPI